MSAYVVQANWFEAGQFFAGPLIAVGDESPLAVAERQFEEYDIDGLEVNVTVNRGEGWQLCQTLRASALPPTRCQPGLRPGRQGEGQTLLGEDCPTLDGPQLAGVVSTVEVEPLTVARDHDELLGGLRTFDVPADGLGSEAAA